MRPLHRALLGVVGLAVIGVLASRLMPGLFSESSSDIRKGIPTPARSATTKASAPASPAAERSTLADALNSPTTDIRADLRLVSDVIETLRTNFPKDGNPVGSNAEITATLVGKNKLRLSLIPPDHAAINKSGELCDRWGTPFFFHAESANKMEIRSAGPDKKMWNDDDAVFTP